MPGTDPDDEANRPVPHPLDRPWIHPSELFAASRPTPDRPANGPRTWRRDVALTVAAGTIGAMAAITVLGLIGTFDRDPARRLSTAEPLARAADAADIAAQVAPGVAAVISTVAGTERRGSGVAVGTHEILTTIDVVGDAPGPATSATSNRVEICMSNGRRHVGTEIGRDAVTGLVLLDVPSLRVSPASLADPDAVRAGDWIVAVGRTATSKPWVTSGVVTAVGGWMIDENGANYAGMITTSTGLASEARGGALVDRRGRVVGILAASGSAPARTAAMPTDLIRDVAEQLAATGTASHGALGVRATDTPERGATITEVPVGTSAETAGLRVGDRVVAIDSDRTPDTASLVYELRRRRAGTRSRITVVRGTRSVKLTATLDDAASTPTDPGGADTPPVTAVSVGSPLTS